MALERLRFTKDWTNPGDFPTYEADEAAVRADMQLLHDETRDYLNETLLPELEELGAAQAVGKSAFKTVAELQASDALPVGTFVETSGYHAELDGGGCVYQVIAAAELLYDIAGNGVSFRPVISGIAYPKQFGTYNDGVTADNAPLQACFDYVADYGIPTIDGENRIYYIDHSTDAITQQDQLHIYPGGITHHGVIIRKGVELKNYKSVLLAGTEILTPVLTLLQGAENAYHIHDCEFHGNYGQHEERPSGTGVDGGRHLLFFTFEDTMFPDEFRPCGDILIERCKLHEPDGYPIMMSACECTYTVRNCDIKSHAMGILTYATNCVVRDCTFETQEHYATMVHNFCHDEIEFGGNYTGGKKKNIEITNCTVRANSVFHIEQLPQLGVAYGSIRITDCVNESEEGSLFSNYINSETHWTRQSIDHLEVRNCTVPNVTGDSGQETISVYGADVGNALVEKTQLASCRFWRSNADEIIFRNLRGAWSFTLRNSGAPYVLKEAAFENVVFNATNIPIFYDAAGVASIRLLGCVSKNRMKVVNASATVNKLDLFIENFKYEELETNAGAFIDIGSSGAYRITIKDAQFLTSFGGNSLIYVAADSAATGRILLQNILAVDLPIVNRGLTLEKMNVAFIGQLDGEDAGLSDADKAEIVETVKAEVPLVKTAEQPVFVSSADEMTDTGKVYVLPDGYLWASAAARPYTLQAEDFQASAMDADGSFVTSSQNTYNRVATKELLPLDGYRVSVSCPHPYQYIVYYYTGPTTDTYIGKTTFKSGTVEDVLSDVVASGTATGAKYCRVSLRDYRDATVDLRGREGEFAVMTPVTRTSTAGAQWYSTGLAYNQPADYEDRVLALENRIAVLEQLMGGN